MKTLISFVLLMCSVSMVHAQQDVSESILDALAAGDAVTLSSYFNDNVELVIGSTNDVFSKQQATGIITDFFRRNKVNSFQVLHKGTKDASAFSICTMKVGSASYRVYVLVRKTSTRQLIQQLRIESSND
ncbi:MAG: DUF4783 domain-containing protein [Paludibacter sp.]|nr:DUF4783 domain-containing protein [Paludibacter sp.]MDD4199042.1 DUF4783 domain-containing protein [Paludibacter sp.]MDD4428222.1 DUF4783 domain-containing protein [Paludibacter sp.]